MTTTHDTEIDEATARVRQLLADTENKNAQTRQLWTQVVLALSAATVAAGALITAGIAVGRYLGGH